MALAIAGAAPNATAGTGASASLPPYTGAYEPQGVDERGIWMDADEQERLVRDSKFVINDPGLNAYVLKILCGAVGEDRCHGVRIYILRVAAFNANMSPNGAMQVWSGLLLRVRSEAELAAVLGHEFAHFELRHSLAGYRQARGATNFMAWTAVLGGPYAASIQLSALGSIFQFNRAQEKQADLLSLEYLKRSRYSAQAASHIWQRLMDEADATALGRKQRSHRYDKVAFFANHPPELDRATYLADLAKDVPTKPENDTEYRAALTWALPDFLADQLRLNDFEGTEYLLGQLALSGGWSAPLLYARGELYRQRGNPRDLVSASGFYRDAVVKQPGFAEAYRGLGLSLLRSAQKEEGSSALKRYLALRPAAPDAAMLTMMTAQ